jgi:ethanolamine ammonia-lyase small subunit
VQAHAVALIAAFLPFTVTHELKLGTVALASGARVALGDEIGAALAARLAVVLIGERPGLSAPDSLGVYLTYHPQPGRTDAERNCISNIRPDGLPPAAAARQLGWLVDASLTRRLTGVMLKDHSSMLAPGQLATGAGPALIT